MSKLSSTQALLLSRVKVRSVDDLLTGEIAPVEFVIDPWLPVQGIAMLSAPTGVGKTAFTMMAAVSIATGRDLLDWKCPAPPGRVGRRVLYVDGEMAMADMKDRLARIMHWLTPEEKKLVRRNLHFYCDGDQPAGIKHLENQQSRDTIQALLLRYDTEVLMLDNLSVLCNSEAESDPGSWVVMQDWLLKLRREGYTTIFLHHTGKPIQNADGTFYHRQRGTSKREDMANTSIILEPRFNDTGWHIVFKKHRGYLAPQKLYVMMDWSEEGFRIAKWKPPEKAIKLTKKNKEGI